MHDNLFNSFSSAQTLIETNSKYGEIIIDTSVCGMGRAPGNLKTEVVAYYLNNMSKSNKYNMDSIYSIIENEINDLKTTLNWDNTFAYGICAFEKSHRTYAEHLINKGMKLSEIQKLIKSIPEENRGRYNEQIMEELRKKLMLK